MPVQRHNVVIPKDDGGIEIYPMKEWLRQHPDVLPGLDPNSTTSPQLRSALRRSGWTMQETPSEVKLIKPGADAGNKIIDGVLGSKDSDYPTDDEPFFSLEYQLRDFLASNLSTITLQEKRLRLFIDPTGRDGIEFPTGVGPIDILAADERGVFFGRRVFGVIVAKSISENLRYAVSVVPNVYLYEYEVESHLRPAHELVQPR